MTENKEQHEYFNLILQEYNAKLARAEHEIILLKVENSTLVKKLKELQEEIQNGTEAHQTQI